MKPILCGIAVGAVLAPLVTVLIRALLGAELALAETLIGALVGTLLLASTAIVATIFYGKKDLKVAVLYSYITKVSLLLVLGLLSPLGDINREALGIAVVISAIAYLITSLTLHATGTGVNGINQSDEV